MRVREKQPRKIVSTKLEDLRNYKPLFPFVHQRIVFNYFLSMKENWTSSRVISLRQFYNQNNTKIRCMYKMMFNPSKTKHRPLYLKNHPVPRCKHFSSRL